MTIQKWLTFYWVALYSMHKLVNRCRRCSRPSYA